jgi:hypothetical protein
MSALGLLMVWGAVSCVMFIFWWGMCKAAANGDRQLGIDE